MWTRLVFVLVALAAATAEYGWKTGQQYTYKVTSKTITGLQNSPQYTGLVLKAQLVVRVNSEQELIAVIDHAEKSQIHTELQKGREFEIPKELLQFQPFPVTKQPFMIRLKDGIIDELVISKEVPIWEVNVIKSIVSQLQVDTQGRRVIPSKMNMIPQGENDLTAVYKIMEDTVEGECETLYDITPLPKYILQRKPHLVPLHEMVKEENIISIVKTKNFTNCNHRPGYHYGITGMTRWEPTTNKMGDFLSRSSVGRLIISGSLRNYIIHSSQTTNVVYLTPDSISQEKGTVHSRVNVTLVSVTPTQQQIEHPTNPQTIKNLVYNYNSPSLNDNEARQKWDKINELSGRPTGTKTRFGRSITGYGNTQERNVEGSSSEEASFETESWHQETPKLTRVPQNPFLPTFVGCNGHNIQYCQNVDINQVVKRLCEQIGTQLQEPNHVPQTSTLERFTILVSVVRNMDAQQLKKSTEELWVKQEEGNSGVVQDPRRSYWMAFRDAVAQSGTGPALVTIKEWILNQKIMGEEAAQVLASVVESTMHPTTEYMRIFFEIVKDQKVLEQAYLNTTAVYSFTKLVRLAQVDRKSIHHRYPIHSFGHFIPLDNTVVAQEYIPYFGSMLQKAVQQQDSPKIQVYIRALGNIAHPKILAVFEPYLDGQFPLTDFQRTLVIVSLNDLAKTHPRIARSVLYKTFSNIGEIHQVRVAALYNLMRTIPPVNLLQRIARSTYDDPSVQVRSAIKTAIESAALLKNPVNTELSRNARAAVSMLNPKVLGVHYSRQNITDFVLHGLNLGYSDKLSYIGSEDSIFPSALFYGLTKDIHGLQRKHFKFGLMVSSVQDLVDFFESTLSVNEGIVQQQTGKDQEWTYEKITKMLNIEHELMKQIEGNVLYKLAGSERYFTFDNHTIENLIEKLVQLPRTLSTGYSNLYQKIYNSDTFHIAFPTVTGFPFVFTHENPRLLYIKSKIQLKSDNSQKTELKGLFSQFKKIGGGIALQGVYSSRTISKTGFVTPFDHQNYVAAIQKEHQINIPVKIEVDANIGEGELRAEIQPIDKSGDLKVFQFNTKKFTAIVDVTEFKPTIEGSNVKTITKRQPLKFQKIVGDKDGLGVRIEVETQNRHLDLQTVRMVQQRHNMISPFVFPTSGLELENTKVDVYYDKNNAKSIIVKCGLYGTYVTGKNGEKVMTKPKQSGIAHEVISEIQKGIQSPEAVVVNVDWEIKGQRNLKYSAVFGYGYSPVAEEKRFAIRYKKVGGEKPLEVSAHGNVKMPLVPETDFNKAIQNQPKGQVSAELRFGEDLQNGAHVTLVGKFERTPERVEYLKKLGQVLNCESEMKNGNNLLSGCMNATYSANLLNRYIFSVKYEKVPVEVKNMTYHVYSFLRHLGFSYVTELLNVEGKTQENKIDLDVLLSPDLASVNTQIRSPIGEAYFKNVRVNKHIKPAVTLHPTWNILRRYGWEVLRQQYDAFCTIDKSGVKTFDNMTYTTHLDNYWIPAFVSVPKVNNEGQLVGPHKIAVLTKETSGNKKELFIYTSTVSKGFTVSVNVKPDSGITVNGEAITYSNQQPYEHRDLKGNLIVRIYELTPGEIKLDFPECNFEVLHAGSRFQVYAGDSYKNRVLGLCGDYNGEKFDFVTPKGKYVRDTEEFIAAWTLTNEGNYGKLKEHVEKKSISKVIIFTKVISDQDAGRKDKRGKTFTNEQQLRGHYDSSSSSSSESHENDSECMTKRVMVVERDGKHCFSIEHQPACKPGCQVEKTKPMFTKFVCVNKTQTSAHWAQMVTRGANPNLGEKLNNVQEITFQAPVECSKN